MITKRLLKKVREFIKEHGKDTDIDRVSDQILLEIIEGCLAKRLLDSIAEHRENSESVIEF